MFLNRVNQGSFYESDTSTPVNSSCCAMRKFEPLLAIMATIDVNICKHYGFSVLKN